MRSLFSLLYPHSCYRNVSECKIFLAVVDRKQKMHKVYEALLDLDYLLGPGQSYLAVLSPIRADTSQAVYAPLSLITDIGRAPSIAQSHAATLALSIRSVYPTQETLSRFPKDLMVRLDKLIDFSPVSKQDLFSRPEKRAITENLSQTLVWKRCIVHTLEDKSTPVHIRLFCPHYLHIQSHMAQNLPLHLHTLMSQKLLCLYHLAYHTLRPSFIHKYWS